MTLERKILIVLGVIICAMVIFGFNKQERYDYSGDQGYGFGRPTQSQAIEYSVSHFSCTACSPWRGAQGCKHVQDHLNMKGSRGWALVEVTEANFQGEYMFFFTRPVAQWR